MSLAVELTDCSTRLLKAERSVSAEVRALRGRIPDAVYGRLQTELCVLTSETNRVKILLGSMRMIGDLEQIPPPVTVESLELAECVRKAPMLPAHPLRDERDRFALELRHIGDDTLDSETQIDRHVSVDGKETHNG